MDLLADSREVIRNDVSVPRSTFIQANSSEINPFDFFFPIKGLLLLQQLTKGNTAIQKIVAFENAFERLLEIITEEGSSDGGMRLTNTRFVFINRTGRW